VSPDAFSVQTLFKKRIGCASSSLVFGPALWKHSDLSALGREPLKRTAFASSGESPKVCFRICSKDCLGDYSLGRSATLAKGDEKSQQENTRYTIPPHITVLARIRPDSPPTFHGVRKGQQRMANNHERSFLLHKHIISLFIEKQKNRQNPAYSDPLRTVGLDCA
jgi:hypothetical protein